MNKQLLLAAVLTALVYGYAEDCSYSKDYSFSVDSASLESLQLDVGAGKLIVTGNSASYEVRVVAAACADWSKRLEDLDLAHHVFGSDLRVITQRYRNGGIFSWLSWGNYYSYIDIEVRCQVTSFSMLKMVAAILALFRLRTLVAMSMSMMAQVKFRSRISRAM